MCWEICSKPELGLGNLVYKSIAVEEMASFTRDYWFMAQIILKSVWSLDQKRWDIYHNPIPFIIGISHDCR